MTAEVDVYTRQEHASLPAKIQYAKLLADSGLLPSSYRKQPANILYAIEYGDMLGLSPMAAITGIHVIEGKPTASAALISALVRRAGHRLRVTGDGEKAVAEIVRSDDPSFTFRSEWTLDRAVQAGLCTLKDGQVRARDSKGRPLPWEKFTAAMLKARAVTEVARDACEEALSGVHYTPEELGAEVDEEGNVVGEIVPGDAPAQQAAASPDPAGDPWVVNPDPDQEAWDAKVAQMAEFATDDDGRVLWAAVIERRKAGLINTAEDKRLKGIITARWAEIKAAADAEVAEEPVDGVIVPDLDPSDPWALKIQEIATTEDAVALSSEVGRELAAGHLDDEKAAAVYAAIGTREAELSGQGALV